MKMRALLLSMLLLPPILVAAEQESVASVYPKGLREIFAHATRVEVYRLSGDSTSDADPENWKKGPVWDEKRAKEIGSVLLGDASYLFNAHKACKPRFGVLLRMKTAAGDFADVWLCFECEMLWVKSEKERTGMLNFDPSNRTFARWAKEAFPNDKEIQALGVKNMSPEEKNKIEREALKMRNELEKEQKK